MSPIAASRPALIHTLTATSTRPFSVAVPARLAHKFRYQSPRGYLAEKGAFPFQQRAVSFDEVMSRSTPAELEELMELRSQATQQKRKIEILQGTISRLLAGEGR
ncbi:uncharacterized protein BDV17DRAFT_273245 [Aspergillus undulatus]|uniref:uncharacterized protein n=1 Tax=Aspergillus undulatus TaxID=1810928 RepID=UPI003CCD37E7